MLRLSLSKLVSGNELIIIKIIFHLLVDALLSWERGILNHTYIIFTFNKYLLSIYYVSSTVLGAGETEVNKTGKKTSYLVKFIV